jgi:hypothetical protein
MRTCSSDGANHALVDSNVGSQRSQIIGEQQSLATCGAGSPMPPTKIGGRPFLDCLHYSTIGAPAMEDTSGTPSRPSLSLDEALDSTCTIEATAAASLAVFGISIVQYQLA